MKKPTLKSVAKDWGIDPKKLEAARKKAAPGRRKGRANKMRAQHGVFS